MFLIQFYFSGRRYILQLYLPVQFCACLLFPVVGLIHFSPNSRRVPHVLRTPGTQRKHCSNLAVIKWNISCLTAANCCGGRRIVSPQCTLICPLHLASCSSLVCSSRNRRQTSAHTVSPKIAFRIYFGAPGSRIFRVSLAIDCETQKFQMNIVTALSVYTPHSVIVICHNNNDNTAN